MFSHSEVSVPETYQIKVLSLTGQKFRINVCANDPVLAVLTTLGNYLRLPPKQLQLVLTKGSYTALNSHYRTLVSYGVFPEDTLHLQLSAVKSGPISFSPTAAHIARIQSQKKTHKTTNSQDSNAPTVTWSDSPAATAPVSQERQMENQQLRQRMSEIRTKMERRKSRASVGTN